MSDSDWRQLIVRLMNFIGGQWCEPIEGRYDLDYNPATFEVYAEVPDSSEQDLDLALNAARNAFKTWRLVPAPARGEMLFRVAHMLEERKEDLAKKMCLDMGKVLVEARGDVQEGIDMAYYMAGEGRRTFGQTTPSELLSKFAMALRDPIGVAAIITPWNFPMAIPTWKIFPALVTGNTVVFKPDSKAPVLAYELVKILQEAGFPKGTVNLVFGQGKTVGEAMLADPRVDLISFTGSTQTGRHIAAKAGEQLKRVSLELGGKNAIIVLNDANLDLAVDGIVWSAFGTTGQRCTACSRIIVQEGIHDELKERLLDRMKTLKLGEGRNESVDVGPLVSQEALNKVERYVAIGRGEGARLEIGGERWNQGADSPGWYYLPTLFTDVNPSMRIAQEEIFGPVLSMIKVKDLDEAVRINNQVTYGLSSSLFRKIPPRKRGMADLTQARA